MLAFIVLFGIRKYCFEIRYTTTFDLYSFAACKLH